MDENNFISEESKEKTKKCSKCKVNIRAKNRNWCKECFNYWARNYYSKRTDLEKKALNSKRNYGVNIEQFKIMIEKCSNKCEICDTEFIDTSKINVDHCHKTNSVRGLLCSKCNYGIGNFNDDIELLKSAIKYLHHYKTT